MLFDATMNMIGYNVEQEEQGIVIAMGLGMPLPFQAGPDQPPVMLPVGNLRFPMVREDAMRFAEAVREAAENLPETPKPSGLVVANQMPKVDVNDISRRLKGQG